MFHVRKVELSIILKIELDYLAAHVLYEQEIQKLVDKGLRILDEYNNPTLRTQDKNDMKYDLVYESMRKGPGNRYFFRDPMHFGN